MADAVLDLNCSAKLRKHDKNQEVNLVILTTINLHPF